MKTQHSFIQFLDRNGAARRWVLPLLAVIFVSMLALAQFATSHADSGSQFTIPPKPVNLTELTGPITDMGANTWKVAGVTIHIITTGPNHTRINKRIENPHANKTWARVQGIGDGKGGLTATRIKVLPPQQFVRLRGILDADIDKTDNSASVDGILVDTTNATIVGNPMKLDRVNIKIGTPLPANISDGLPAVQIVAQGVPSGPGPKEDPEEDNTAATILIGVVQQADPIVVSGISVQVNAQAIVDTRVAPLLKDSWVLVEGQVQSDGTLLATRVKTIASRQYGEVTGTLTDLGDTTNQLLVVGGISIPRDQDTKMPQGIAIGQRVKVTVQLAQDNSLSLAITVARSGGETGDNGHGQGGSQPGALVHFTGSIQAISNDGKTWTIDNRTVLVNDPKKVIDDHKGPATVGAKVTVVALVQGKDLVALEIVVKQDRPEDSHPGDKPGNGNNQGNDNKPGNGNNQGNGDNPGNSNKPGNGNNQGTGQPRQ